MLSTEAVSAHIDIPVPTLTTWRSLGKGPVFYKLGKLIRYRLSDVESWINSNRRGPDESQETLRETRSRCSPWPFQSTLVPSERKG
jgi:Helix-turn-helix domain